MQLNHYQNRQFPMVLLATTFSPRKLSSLIKLSMIAKQSSHKSSLQTCSLKTISILLIKNCLLRVPASSWLQEPKSGEWFIATYCNNHFLNPCSSIPMGCKAEFVFGSRPQISGYAVISKISVIFRFSLFKLIFFGIF